MHKRVNRPGVRAGYDLWASSYDTTPNPLVALDRQYTISHLDPRKNEYILDAGCGTGAHMKTILGAGSFPAGLDFSRGMLLAAKTNVPGVPFAQADLNDQFPIKDTVFDAVLCSLVSEHLINLQRFFRETFVTLKYGGRFVFSAFHPELVASGIEANFEQCGTEYRLGAEKHTVEDFLTHCDQAGFRNIKFCEYKIDKRIADTVPKANKYLNKSLLLIIKAKKPAN